MKLLFSHNEILDLIPQRTPFVMIDKFFEPSEGIITTGLTIRESNVLLNMGLLQEGGIIEHVAQSAAAGVGYKCQIENKPVPVGFIGAVKRLVINRLPVVGEELITTITIISDIMNASIIKGEVFVNGDKIAECDMNIFLEEEKKK